jgi:hypothetical protein
VIGVNVVRADSGCGGKVNLQAPPPDNTTLPSVVDGVPVHVEVVGAIRKA